MSIYKRPNRRFNSYYQNRVADSNQKNIFMYHHVLFQVKMYANKVAFLLVFMNWCFILQKSILEVKGLTGRLRSIPNKKNNFLSVLKNHDKIISSWCFYRLNYSFKDSSCINNGINSSSNLLFTLHSSRWNLFEACFNSRFNIRYTGIS